MEPLGDTDAEDLLLKRVFPNNGRCPDYLKETFFKILRKCNGIPLAITTVSPLLVDKWSERQWNYVYDSLNREEADPSIDTMRKIFWLSYYDLPHHLRTCLLYFSMFPEDMEIKRKRLINRWAAEGFISTRNGEDVNQKGQQYFDELVNKCLIQPLNIKYDGEARACRVHDIIHEYIIMKAIEENFVALQLHDCINRCTLVNSKFRRLSVQNSEDGFIKLERDMSRVRSLTVFGKIKEIPYQKVCTPLRVLDLEDATIKDQEFMDIRKHPHLRYLTLTRQNNYAPENIECLEDLETLNLCGNILQTHLTSGVINLQRLVRLFVDKFAELPVAVTNLVALEELKGFNVYTQSLDFLQNLSNLVNLRVLGIHWWFMGTGGGKTEKENLLMTSLRKLLSKRLQSISVIVGDDEFGSGYERPHIDQWFIPVSDSDDGDPTTMRLQKFCVTGDCIIKFPHWISHRLNKLEKLRLCFYTVGQEDLDILSRLPSLLYLFLDLDFFSMVDTRLTVSGFKYLKFFGSNVIPYKFEKGSMPQLKHLKLNWPCQTMTEFSDGFGIEVLAHVPLIEITIIYNSENDKDHQLALQTEAYIKTATKNFSNLSTIKINKEYGWY